MIAKKESGGLAEKLIVETCAKQGIEKDQLILHSDRGSAMRSKTVTDLLGARAW
jgi:putative transposase